MRKSTRIVSLVLVLLMLVGMMPLAMFAAGADASGATEEGYCNTPVALPSDEDISNIGATKWFAENFEAVGSYTATEEGTNLTSHDPTNGKLEIAGNQKFEIYYPKTLWYHLKDGNRYLRLGSEENGATQNQTLIQHNFSKTGHNTGYDFVYSVDVKYDSAFSVAINLIKVLAGTNISLIDIEPDGAITIPTTKEKVGYADSETFTTIAVRTDVAAGKYYAYINGICINNDGYNLGYNSTAAVTWIRTCHTTAEDRFIGSICFDNIAFYYKSANAAEKLTYIGEREKPAILDKGNTVAMPSATDIADIGATNLFVESFDGPINNMVATYKGTNLTESDKKASVLSGDVLNIYYPDNLWYHLEANGNKYLRLENTKDSYASGQQTLFQTKIVSSTPIDIVSSMDIKLGDDYKLNQWIALFKMRNYQGTEFNFLNLNTDNSISIHATGEKIAYLNSDTFTTVAIRIDMAAGKFYVYINGGCTNSAGYATDITSSYWFFNFHQGQSKFKGSVYIDNFVSYYKASNAAEKLVYLGEREHIAFTEDFEEISGYEATPEGTGITDETLFFEGIESKVNYPDNLYYHLDANGNRYLRFENTRTLTDGDVYSTGEQTLIQQKITANGISGMDLVYTIDVKLGSDFSIDKALSLIRLVDYRKAEIDLVTIYGDGGIAASSTTHRVGYLSSEEFTTVAVRVDMAANRYYIYVNDICVDNDGYVFIPNNDANMQQYGVDGVIDARKYTVSFIRALHQNPSHLKGSICFDNIACYYKDVDAPEKLTYIDEDTTEHPDEFVDGVYYADTRKLGAYVMGYTLGMEGKISVNYFLNLTAVPKSDDVYVEFTVNGEVTKAALNTLEKTDKGYKATVSIPAAEMTDTIKAAVKYNDTVLYKFADYSAIGYAKTILESDEYGANAKAAVKAMLNYATAAQIEFGHKLDTLANAILDESDRNVADNSEAIIDKAGASLNNNISEGVSYNSTTLGLEGETAIYHFFNVTDTVLANYEVDGADEVKMIGNLLRVKIAGVKAADLDEKYAVTVTYGGETLTISANAFAYAKTVVKNPSDESLVNVINALYAYYAAAEAYNAAPNA